MVEACSDVQTPTASPLKSIEALTTHQHRTAPFLFVTTVLQDGDFSFRVPGAGGYRKSDAVVVVFVETMSVFVFVRERVSKRRAVVGYNLLLILIGWFCVPPRRVI